MVCKGSQAHGQLFGKYLKIEMFNDLTINIYCLFRFLITQFKVLNLHRQAKL